MTYDQFWYGDPSLAKVYYKSYRLKRELNNQEMWLQGMYIYNAFTVVMNNSFSKGKKMDYPKEPYDIFPEEHQREREEKQRQELIRKLEQFKRNFDRNDNRKS